MSRVAVIGAGVAGLAAGHELAKAGWGVDVYERWPGLGGQAATLDVGDGVLLERYYHHLFTSDEHIAELCRELGLEIDFCPRSSVSSPRAPTIRSPPRGSAAIQAPHACPSRMRMGLAVVMLQRRYREVGPLEGMTAHEWVVRRWAGRRGTGSGARCMRGKFSDRAEDISMAWLWARLKRAAPDQGLGDQGRGARLSARAPSSRCFAGSREEIEAHGGRVLIDRPAAKARREDGAVHGDRREATTPSAPATTRGSSRRPGREHYDAVIATVANPIFERLLDDELKGGLSRRVPRSASLGGLPRRALPGARAGPALLALLLDEHRRPGRAFPRD